MSASTLIRYTESKRLECLERHIEEWIRVLDDYAVLSGDSPFQYRERTQVGFFAAASWRIGIPALEEWRFTKGIEENPIKGRCDLWMQTGNYHIEAKHGWSDITGSESKTMTNINGIANDAKASAARLTCDPKCKLAFSFLAPCISIENLKDLDQHCFQWLETIRKVDCDAIAWYLPERHRTDPFDFPVLAVGLLLMIHRLQK